MIRTQEATGKTVDEARTNACALLGVEKDDINVSYDVLAMPQKTGFLGLKLWKSLLLPLRKLPLPKSRLLPPQRAKRWKSPSTSRRTPRSRPLWTT